MLTWWISGYPFNGMTTETKGGKKRGRPATGRKADGALYLRVPSGQKEAIRKMVKAHLSGFSGTIDEIIKNNKSKAYDKLKQEIRDGNARGWVEVGVGASVEGRVESNPDQSETIKALGQEIERLKGELALKVKGLEVNGDKGQLIDRGMDFKPEGELWSYGELKRQAGMAAESARVAGEKVEELEGRLQRCAEATDDQKARWWMVKCKEAQARVAQLESMAGYGVQ